MDTSRKHIYVLSTFFLALMTTQAATVGDGSEAAAAAAAAAPCFEISAAVTSKDFEHYLFSGNKFTRYNPTIMYGNQKPEPLLISEFENIEPDVQISAGYVEPNSNRIARLFAGSDLYRVDLEDKKVLEKMSVSALLSKSELAHLEKGIQAVAAVGYDIYFFSGCKILQTDLHGKVRYFDLEKLMLPCDVTAAFAYPRKNANHLLIIKGADAYGWFLTSNTPSIGYYMFCVNKVLRNTAFNLCDCGN